MEYIRNIDEIVETLKNAKERKKACTLLVGAGCSVKAGIPTAAGFVEVIKARYPKAYERAEEKTYPKCMAELMVAERRDLIAEYVDKAKINWAHICIASLMQNGYVDRVLTTNFDLLVVRACSLIGEYPAVYDFAASQLYKAADIPDKAVFYLHGQRTGFVIMNTVEDCQRHAKLLGPVFEDAGRGRVWIVVGYSGSNDPVFDHLAKVPQFDNGLFWIGYEKTDPPKHVLERLLQTDKSAFYTNGYDADSFFVTLTQKLQIFPPQFVSRPFSHLGSCLQVLTGYTLPGQEAEENVMRRPMEWIQKAIHLFEEATADEIKTVKIDTIEHAEIKARFLLMAGEYEKVIQFLEEYQKSPTPELGDNICWAFIMSGNSQYKLAQTKTGSEADKLFEEAYKKYEAALKIIPDKHDALNNWGNALSEQAKTKTGPEADKFFEEAYKKYEAALKIEPDDHEILNNWGSTLFEQAKTKTGPEADKFFEEAYKKYEAALKIIPDYYEALNNWGGVLSEQAKTKTGSEADELFEEGYKKYGAAVEIEPNYRSALRHWGVTLSYQAKLKGPDEANTLYLLSKEKLERADGILPGFASYDLACIYALLGDEDICRQWLQKSKEKGFLPSKEYILNDSDLDSVRHTEWFQQLLDNIK
jgi:tetratricopeptide (TPR) repeat protein